MSCAMARRSGVAASLSARARRWSAACSAARAPRTLPASCSCWLASTSICSTSESTRSSALRASSRYISSSATRCSCVSATRAFELRDAAPAHPCSAACACAATARDCAAAAPSSARRPPALDCMRSPPGARPTASQPDRHGGHERHASEQRAHAVAARHRRRAAGRVMGTRIGHVVTRKSGKRFDESFGARVRRPPRARSGAPPRCAATAAWGTTRVTRRGRAPPSPDHRDEILQCLARKRAHRVDLAARPGPRRAAPDRRAGASAGSTRRTSTFGPTRLEHLAQVLPAAFAAEHDDTFPLDRAQFGEREQRLAVVALRR